MYTWDKDRLRTISIPSALIVTISLWSVSNYFEIHNPGLLPVLTSLHPEHQNLFPLPSWDTAPAAQPPQRLPSL